METLLRQKVGKSKHNFLITKCFCRENTCLPTGREQRSKRKDFTLSSRGTKQSGANGLGFNEFRFPAIRFTPPAGRQAGAAPIGARLVTLIYSYKNKTLPMVQKKAADEAFNSSA